VILLPRAVRFAPSFVPWIVASAWLAAATSLAAQTDRQSIERLEQERTQQQQRAATSMAPMVPTLNAGAPALAWQPPVPAETPCAQVDDLAWQDTAQDMPREVRAILDSAPGYRGQCLGAQSLERLRGNLDARLLAAGFVTSRATFPPQDLSTGTLLVGVELGRIQRIVQRLPSGAMLQGALSWLPLQPGDVLNLRDIEQAVENAQRLPSWTVQVAIEPAEEPGASNLVLVHRGGPRWRARGSLDNQALEDFGRWQLGLQASLDLGWLGADQLSLWHQRSATGLSP
jgi:hemolysin activation/secretion protein